MTTTARDPGTGKFVPPSSEHDQIVELRQQLKSANKALEEKQRLLNEASPTVDISHRLFRNVEDVYEYFDEQKLRDLAESTLVGENRIRQRTGLSPLRFEDDEWEAAIEQVAEELLADRALNGAKEEGPLTRTLKMYNPKDDSIRQIPYEGQFNNVAGSLADGLIIYERKGFKRVDPFICPSMDCGFEAVIITSGKEKGKWRYNGYCSEDHFNRTEKRNLADVPGLDARPAAMPR